MRTMRKNMMGAAEAGHGAAALGDLPEWDLSDLYSGINAPELKADLDKAARDAASFESRWKGTLAAEAEKAAAGGLGEALRDFESVEELIGRIASYAGLVYAGDTSDPKRAKLYGDIQEKMTDASAHLLFFALELNLIDDDLILKRDGCRSGLRPLPAMDPRPPEGPPLPARGPHRAAVPRKVDHRARRLEPPVRRDDDRPALRHRRRAAVARTDAEPAAGRRRQGAPAGLRSAGRDLRRESPDLHADHQHAGQGQGNLRPLARLSGHRRFTPPRQPRREERRGCAGRRRSRSLSAPVAPLLCDEGALARHGCH